MIPHPPRRWPYPSRMTVRARKPSPRSPRSGPTTIPRPPRGGPSKSPIPTPGQMLLANCHVLLGQRRRDIGSKWFTSVPAGARQGSGDQRFTGNLLDNDPKTAMEWANSIGDQKMREDQVINLTRNWMRTDPDSARLTVGQPGQRLARTPRQASADPAAVAQVIGSSHCCGDSPQHRAVSSNRTPAPRRRTGRSQLA